MEASFKIEQFSSKFSVVSERVELSVVSISLSKPYSQCAKQKLHAKLVFFVIDTL